MLPAALPDPGGVEVSEHLHLDPLPKVVSMARSFVRQHLPADVSDDVCDTVLLLTSELVTNAVIHARTRLEVGITVSDRFLLISVHDEDLGRSALPGPPREGGRGLALVRALAEATATEQHSEGGKTVWFRIPRDDLQGASS